MALKMIALFVTLLFLSTLRPIQPDDEDPKSGCPYGVDYALGKCLLSPHSEDLENDRLIKAKVRELLANDPVIRTISVVVDDNRDVVIKLLTPQHGLQYLDSVSISDPEEASTSANNLVAYRPNYDDIHRGNNKLGVVFLNLNGIFPCVQPNTRIPCGIVSLEEDGFSNGRVFIQATDRGNDFRIFRATENFYTYGIAVQGCSKLNRKCWPTWVEKGVTCQLPRQYCG